MSLSIKTAGIWKEISSAHIKVGGVWKQVSEGWVKVGGVWKKAWDYLSVLVQVAPQTANPIGGTGNIIYRSDLAAVITGGVSPFTYLWSNTGGGSISSPTDPSPNISATFHESSSDTAEGMVSCTVTDTNGFSASNSSPYTLG